MIIKPKLLEQVAIKIREKHYARSTEKTYCYWAKQFILFHHKKHPREMGKIEIEAFLSHLVVKKNVAVSTQDQAFNALLFLYRVVLEMPFPTLNNVVRSKRPQKLPVVIDDNTPSLEFASLVFVCKLKILHFKPNASKPQICDNRRNLRLKILIHIIITNYFNTVLNSSEAVFHQHRVTFNIQCLLV